MSQFRQLAYFGLLVFAGASPVGLLPQAARAGGDEGAKPSPVLSEKKSVGKARAGSAKAAVRKKEDAFKLPPPFFQRPEQKAAREEIAQSSLSAAVKEKMLKGNPLKLDEVEELGKSGLSQEIMLKALRSAGGTYQLVTKDIDRLRMAGLADDVLDYLLSTPARRPIYYPYLYSYPSFYHYDSFHHDDHHSDFGHHDSFGHHDLHH